MFSTPILTTIFGDGSLEWEDAEAEDEPAEVEESGEGVNGSDAREVIIEAQEEEGNLETRVPTKWLAPLHQLDQELALTKQAECLDMETLPKGFNNEAFSKDVDVNHKETGV